ncbi:hypothetical protein DASC09_020120 [Saccharomycopsis crataegensis]|uniref:Cell division control protein 14 n=1 Tax=Saccharomycopsis crataegensis TaxID=43959 RepID=A0AAV5QJF1_9ASCO|nr:hypothetical protein DASC09_020120 [Saccharomycopsis crataegensis]
MSELEEYLNDSLSRLYTLEPSSIHDGLQRLDALLGQLCVQTNNHKKSKMLSQYKDGRNLKSQYNHLKRWKVPDEDDAIFGEFIKLQNSFEYNIATGMIFCLNQFNIKTNNKGNIYPQEFILLAHKVLQGVLLLHPESRNLFFREANMKLLLSFLVNYKHYMPSVQCSAVQTFVCCLVRSVKNLRKFETLGGVEITCNLFNKKSTSKEVKLKILEFLFFYLIPETNINLEKSFEMDLDESVILNQSKHLYKDGYIRRTMKEKAANLKQYIANVDDLVQELVTSKPFGEMNIEW